MLFPKSLKQMLDLLKRRNQIIKNGCRFINDSPKIINGSYKILNYNDEPKLYGYTIHFNDIYKHDSDENSMATGVSFDKQKALLKVLGETIERYCLGTNNNKKFIYKSFNDLIASKKPVLTPESFSPYKHDKNYNFNLSRRKLHWIKGRFLISNKPVFMPAQIIYLPYVYYGSEPLLRFDNSTGAAAGITLKDALYRGICEIVERDSFMIAYLNKIACPKIDLLSMKDKHINNIVNILKRYKLEIVVLDTTTDLKIPSCAALIIDKTGIGPSISTGLKAGFDIKDTVIGAIEESLMVRSWIRDRFVYKDSAISVSKTINTIEDRVRFWFPVDAINHLDFWLKNKNIKSFHPNTFNYSGNNLERATDLLKDNNIEALYVNITDKEIKKYNFVVVKVVMPQLQPLYLDERNAFLEEKRLRDASVKMGQKKHSRVKNQFNEIPHPFL